jgi:hypothetical protein
MNQNSYSLPAEYYKTNENFQASSENAIVHLVRTLPSNIVWFLNIDRDPPEGTLPREFGICCLLVTVVPIVGSDSFHSFDPAVKTVIQTTDPHSRTR